MLIRIMEDITKTKIKFITSEMKSTLNGDQGKWDVEEEKICEFGQ